MAIERLAPNDTFLRRHVGPSPADVQTMLTALGYDDLDAFVGDVVPAGIRTHEPMGLGAPLGENAVLEEMSEIAAENRSLRSFIGMGYHGTIVPGVIQRNILENPGWYTQYTPYQAEISQGRLEALFNFQTMVADLTGLPVANSSLLDEATAAAEALSLCIDATRGKRNAYFVADDCHPQTIAVVQTRAEALDLTVHVGDAATFDFAANPVAGALVQYPCTHGRIHDYTELADQVHASGALFVVAADLLALTLLKPPGEFGADVVIGSAQRFGVPMGYGGPHAAFMTTSKKHQRRLPGRIIGLSKDSQGNSALRMALQTREQHIRREKATSNICTAQVLLAIMSGMYGVYHGPAGLRAIAERIHGATCLLAAALRQLGLDLGDAPFFDTLRVNLGTRPAGNIMRAALERGINLRRIDDHTVGVSLDETVTEKDLHLLVEALTPDGVAEPRLDLVDRSLETGFAAPFARTSDYMTHRVFHAYHSETEMLRYIRRLESRDLSLCQSMISLGSCTMKLNGTTEMVPITWPRFGNMHPFAPLDQAKGYQRLIRGLEDQLARITGFDAVSLQPNAGSQGEYAGLLVIRRYHQDRGEGHRTVCLIPSSAHGTNPASAVMAGMKVVVVKCDDRGDIDVEDLRAKVEQNKDDLGALMVTYPSTHGVFEAAIRDICEIIHGAGGQVYMDGANMNAQVGLTHPGFIGADVCHLNLHKTFCIPHGGGGPGVGPIGVAKHLTRFLPGHPVIPTSGAKALGPVSAAPWGSPSILPISYVYIRLLGDEGLTRATEVAMLNANYMAKRLAGHFPVLYTGDKGLCAHEFILDLRPLEAESHVTAEDVAKRLMDYGFHAPTMSFPVTGTLMVEPTESESLEELDRFCEAMIAIHGEITDVVEGRADTTDNVLKNAPHTSGMVTADEWTHAYSRKQAAFPLDWVGNGKFWPAVARIDNVWGDRNLICTCPPMEAYEE